MSQIRIVSLSDSEPGMILAKDIMNDYGAVIMYKNSKLDEQSIKRLSNMGITIVQIYKDYSTSQNKQKVIEASYSNNIVQVNDIFKNIRGGKPLEFGRIKEIVENLNNNFDSYNEVIACLNKIRAAHEYTYNHSLNVSLLCNLIGNWLNFEQSQISMLSHCGLLHDIGKAKISPELLNKPDPLTDKELIEIKKHPVVGYEILKDNIIINKDISLGVLMHHEREDGSGYPLGLKSHQINLFAKIVAIADVFDAMTSERTYKKRQPAFNVLEMYESEYLTKCDTKILMVFLKHISSYYIGSMVKLSTGESGEIVYINPNNISRPLIKLKNSLIIDLCKEAEIKITEVY